MLHVANGEGVAHLLRQAGVEGEVADADDLWMEGPLGVGPEERAQALSRRFAIPAQEYLARTRAREEVLGRALLAPEVAFWTEEDLFCQANLCEALSRFPPTHPRRVLLVAPERAHERLGHLPPERLAERLDEAQPLHPERLRLAHRAWRALSSADPRDVERLLAEDYAAWPALHEGILGHLRRFPGLRTGLDAVEEEILHALEEGHRDFADLFPHLQRSPRFWPLGMGDVQLAAQVRELSPLVAVEGDAPPRWRLALTRLGRDALEGRLDALAARPGLERWIGGARVAAGRAWRWDEERMRLVVPPP